MPWDDQAKLNRRALAAGIVVDAMDNCSGGALVTTACAVLAIIIIIILRFVSGMYDETG